MYFWPFVFDTNEGSPIEGFYCCFWVEIVALDYGPDVVYVSFYGEGLVWGCGVEFCFEVDCYCGVLVAGD